jgi:hypothetical protein
MSRQRKLYKHLVRRKFIVDSERMKAEGLMQSGYRMPREWFHALPLKAQSEYKQKWRGKGYDSVTMFTTD